MKTVSALMKTCLVTLLFVWLSDACVLGLQGITMDVELLHADHIPEERPILISFVELLHEELLAAWPFSVSVCGPRESFLICQLLSKDVPMEDTDFAACFVGVSLDIVV